MRAFVVISNRAVASCVKKANCRSNALRASVERKQKEIQSHDKNTNCVLAC